MHIVQPSNLGEQSGESLLIMLSEIDSSRPIIPPFDHRSRLENIASDFVNVVTIPFSDLWPVAELYGKNYRIVQ